MGELEAGTESLRPAHSKPVRLAATAYRAGLAGQWPKAVRAIQRVYDECGAEGVLIALLAWCDAYIDHATGGKQVDGTRAGVKFMNTETGELDGERSDRMPEPVRWAGQLVVARGAMDEPRFMGLIDALPDDKAAVGRYVLAVLQCVVTSINTLPRGFVLMGRGLEPGGG